MDQKRRLIVMRHAKSSWKSEARDDHSRPLNQRGQRAAPDVAKQLVDAGWQPGFVLSSDALRTRETIGLMLNEFVGEVTVEFFNSLYLAGYQEVLQEVMVVPDTIETLLVLGHNPGWGAMVGVLSNQHVEMKTANCALLEIEATDWRTALEQRSAWRMVDYLQPS